MYTDVGVLSMEQLSLVIIAKLLFLQYFHENMQFHLDGNHYADSESLIL